MRQLIGADSLSFISIDGLYSAMGVSSRNSDEPHYCDACFTGNYPVPVQLELSKFALDHGSPGAD